MEPVKEMAISSPKPAYSKNLGSREEVVPQDARSLILLVDFVNFVFNVTAKTQII